MVFREVILRLRKRFGLGAKKRMESLDIVCLCLV